MAVYSVETRNGSIINVPDYSVLHIDGLEIIGDQTTDWNEPYNKNFLTLDKKIMAVESLVSGVSGVDLTGINTDISSIKTEIVSIKDSIASGSGSATYDDTLIKSRIDTLNGRVDSLVLSISNKVDKVAGKGLSTEDFTSSEKSKLNTVEPGAQVNSVLTVAGKTGNVGLVIGDVNGLQEALASGLVNDVTSVNGKKGAVVLGVDDITGLSSVISSIQNSGSSVQESIESIKLDIDNVGTIDKSFDYFRDGSNIATYLFNGNTNDSIGTKHSTYSNGVSFADGKFGKAVVSSPNSKIAFGNIHGNATTVVVAGWVKLTNTDSVSMSNILFGFDTYGLVHYIGGIGFNSYNGDCYGVNDTGLLNTWKHVVVEFTQGAYGKLWIDGVEQVLAQRQGVPNYSSCKTADKGFNVFATDGTNVSGNFGMIDNIRVFNRSLTLSEINSLYLNNEVNTIEDLYTVVDGIKTEVDGKVNLVSGKGLSSEDFTTAEKIKLESLSNYVKPLSEPISYIEGLETALASGSKVDIATLDGDLLPSQSSVYNIGSATKRWKGIYVDEAYLAVHTLYLGDTPILGTEQDTIVIKANANQSINMQTSGTGTTDITSQNGVQISTSGTNADVKVQATGTNSKVRFAGSGGIELSSPVSAQSDVSVSGNLTVSGNIVHNGSQFIVNATTVTAKDNIIVVNQGEVGTGVTAGKAGIQVDRGEAADYQLVFDETIDKFVVGAIGGVYETLATREYVSGAIANVDISSKANVNHTHSTIDVTGLDSALAGKVGFTSSNTLDLGEM